MEDLVTAGHEVVGVCRSGRSEAPEGARIEAADVSDVEAARRVAAGADVVHGCVGIPYPVWLDQWPGIVDGLLAAAEGARLVFADNLYCYGPQNEPLTAGLPLTDFGRKPALRARMVRTMLEAHQSGRVEVAMVRASDFYGPRVLNAALGERVFANVLDGKSAQILGNGTFRHTFTFVPDFCRALRTVAEAEDDAYGQAWHVPSAPAQAPRAIIRRFSELAGVEARVQPLPRLLLMALGLFVPLMRELKEMRFQWDRSYEVVHEKFATRFRGDFTALDEGLQATLEWYRAQQS